MQKDITRDLKCELTKEELLIYSMQLAKNQQDKDHWENNTKVLLRTDTFEIVETAAITPEG